MIDIVGRDGLPSVEGFMPGAYIKTKILAVSGSTFSGRCDRIDCD